MRNQYFQGIEYNVENVENVDIMGNHGWAGKKVSTYLMCVFAI